MMTSRTAWRWTEIDPLGQVIRCGETEWQHVIAGHPDVAAHEAAVRATIRTSDAIYGDPRSTAITRERGNPAAQIVHYVASGRTHGRYTGNVVVVVVKWLPEGQAGQLVGYVQTAYLPNRLLRRLHLQWEQGP